MDSTENASSLLDKAGDRGEEDYPESSGDAGGAGASQPQDPAGSAVGASDPDGRTAGVRSDDMNGNGSEQDPVQRGSSSTAIRSVFLGNLHYDAVPIDIVHLFEHPVVAYTNSDGVSRADPKQHPVLVDHVDLKRGFGFVFLKDATCEEDKIRAENYVTEINGILIPKVSDALRAEFARGDGRVKRKEDLRRARIAPSETLFVVNFHEETTKNEDLRMLFEPYGKLVRIDMKKNFAFVQFETIQEATRAKDATNGGKLDQSVITVEYVARKPSRVDSRGGGGYRDRGRSSYDDRRGGGGGYRGGGGRDRDDYRGGGGYRGSGRDDSGGGRGASPPRYGGRSNYSDRYDDRDRGRSPDRGGVGGRYDGGGVRGGGRYDSPARGGGRSMDRYPYDDRDRDRSGRGGRDRSRSRSPPPAYRGGRPGGRSRSPPRRDYDSFHDVNGRRGRSPDRDLGYRGGGDRGYGGR